MMWLAQIEENRANFSLEVEKLDNKNTALAEVPLTAWVFSISYMKYIMIRQEYLRERHYILSQEHVSTVNGLTL